MSGDPAKKEWLFRAQDMVEQITLLQETLDSTTKKIFLENAVLLRATERYFEIIGEAARLIPKNIQEKYNNIAWAEIISMRNKIAHDYLTVSPDILWLTYETKLDELKSQLHELIEQEDNS